MPEVRGHVPREATVSTCCLGPNNCGDEHCVYPGNGVDIRSMVIDEFDNQRRFVEVDTRSEGEKKTAEARAYEQLKQKSMTVYDKRDAEELDLFRRATGRKYPGPPNREEKRAFAKWFTKNEKRLRG